MRRAWIVAAFAPMVVAAQQAPPSGRGVTLGAAIAYALVHSPDVLVASATVDSAVGERRAATAIPNPILASVPNTPFQYSATIPVDLTPQRWYRSQVAWRGVDASQADRRDVERQVTLNVARAFFDVLLAKDKRDITAQRRDVLLQVLRSDSARVHAGDLPESNLARSEVEFVRADAGVSRAEADLEIASLSLQQTMGMLHAEPGFSVVGALDYRREDVSLDSLLAVARQERPDVQAAQLRVAQSSALVSTARSSLVPTPELSLVRQYSAPFESGRYYALGLSFELPSLNWYGGARERASAGLDAARVNAQRASAQAEREVRAAMAEFRVQRDLVERYRGGLLTNIGSAVDAARYAYDRGATSLLELLDVIRAQQDVRDDYATALHDYWVAAYALNAAVGAPVLASPNSNFGGAPPND